MSSDSDLVSAFGRPARDLSSRLSRNPRRTRREDTEEAADHATGAAPDQEVSIPAGSPNTGRSAAPTAPPGEDGARQRHLDAAPTAAPQDDAPEAADTAEAPAPPPSNGAKAAPAGAGEPESAGQASSAPERTTSSRSRRATGGGRSRAATRNSSSRSSFVELDPSTSYQVPVYVHPRVREAATALRKTEKLTNAEIAFNAIDEVQHRLGGLIRDRRLQARPGSSLFPARVRRGRLGGGGAASTAGEARRVLWGFRATGEELEIIDRLAADSGAESRSELVAVALEETLLR